VVEDYEVTGYEDQKQMTGQGNNMLSLFDVSQFKMDSRKTSASTTLQQQISIQGGGSLTTILQQSLVSEDKEQIDWILSQRDPVVIDKTLMQLDGQKDSKTISLLFKILLEKFQQSPTQSQPSAIHDQLALSLWLKHALKIHWSTIVLASQHSRHGDPQSFVASLQGLKYTIDSKCKHLSQLLAVKGKLDMLRNCQMMATHQSKASAPLADKYSKIKTNIEKAQQRQAMAGDQIMEDNAGSEDEEEEQTSVLMYKHASDDEMNDEFGRGEGDASGSEEDEDDDDYDEEIEQVPIKGKR